MANFKLYYEKVPVNTSDFLFFVQKYNKNVFLVIISELDAVLLMVLHTDIMVKGTVTPKIIF